MLRKWSKIPPVTLQRKVSHQRASEQIVGHHIVLSHQMTLKLLFTEKKTLIAATNVMLGV